MKNEKLKYTQLRKLGQELHIPIPEAFWELEVFDQEGKLIHRHKQRSHSWVRNAYNLLFCQLAGKNASDSTFGPGLLSAKETDGNVRSGAAPFSITRGMDYSADGTDAGYRAPAGSDNRGIMVGSGTAAESFEDFALQTKIANGTGAGQLSYVQSEAHSVTYDAANKILKNTLIRYFNNNSGGNVSVNEVGLAFCSFRIVPSAVAYYLSSRDKLATTVTVPNTGQLKVTYTIQLTYPA
jgi:hypothetical protein